MFYNTLKVLTHKTTYKLDAEKCKKLYQNTPYPLVKWTFYHAVNEAPLHFF